MRAVSEAVKNAIVEEATHDFGRRRTSRGKCDTPTGTFVHLTSLSTPTPPFVPPPDIS